MNANIAEEGFKHRPAPNFSRYLKGDGHVRIFSSSTGTVNSKRAIAECLENALEGEKSLNCDLIIFYTSNGHNFSDILTEARRLSPNAQIVGCTGCGIIGREGPNESMKALAIMAIKGEQDEFAVAGRDTLQTTEEGEYPIDESPPHIVLKEQGPKTDGKCILTLLMTDEAALPTEGILKKECRLGGETLCDKATIPNIVAILSPPIPGSCLPHRMKGPLSLAG